MIDILNLVLSAIGVGIATLLAYGGALGAIVAWAARIHPAVPRALSEAVVYVLIGVSVWHFSGLSHDRQREVDRLEAVIAEQVRQRKAAEDVMRRAQAIAALRIDEARNLQETVNDYANALAAGDASACPADPAYSRRMHAIRIGSPPKPATAGN